MRDTVIVEFCWNNSRKDVEVPKNITADELITSFNSGFSLGIDETDSKDYLFRAENPIALIKGDITLEELGIRDGTVIYFKE
ncbi:EsaB/YukD family protein [Pseudobutyrivibrio ruminis]|uniref:EsaB/YukD family protein n=1 Tax=Pseudobutyrivibrio ruminis TaxID=46206 RepID=UPI0005681C2F|nr:EsaB/YukD family protein [Pseudobutyrivibrio ruminis]